MKNTKNTKLVGFEPMSNAETEKVVGGKKIKQTTPAGKAPRKSV